MSKNEKQNFDRFNQLAVVFLSSSQHKNAILLRSLSYFLVLKLFFNRFIDMFALLFVAL